MITEDTRLGPRLRARRETLGLSLEDVEAAIRIRARYLLALETDEWQRLPGEVVGRGFLQNYADFLKLDGGELKQNRQSEELARLNEEWANTSAGTQMPPPRDMDYRPLEAQQVGDFFLTGRGPAGAWRRLLATVLVLAAIGLVTAAFFTDLYSGFLSGPVLTDLQMEVSAWAQTTYGRLSADFLAPRPTVQIDNGEQVSAPSLAVEVAAPTPVLQPTPANTQIPVPTPVAAGQVEPAPAPTPIPTPVQVDSALTPVECEVEGMQITYPLEGQIVNGTVFLTGTVAVPDQWYYKLEYRIVAGEGQAQRQAFTYFDGYVTSVTDGTLGELNTLGLANGTYTLRLTAVQGQDAEPLVCDSTITIQN